MDMTFFTFICCKNCIVCLKKTENKQKRGRGWPNFSKKRKKVLQMIGFVPRTSGIWSDHSANWATARVTNKQCDQIGRLINFDGSKPSHKSCQNIWWLLGLFWNSPLFKQKLVLLPLSSLWNTLGNYLFQHLVTLQTNVCCCFFVYTFVFSVSNENFAKFFLKQNRKVDTEWETDLEAMAAVVAACLSLLMLLNK